MSAELVPINNEIAEATNRRAALERLNVAAESAKSPAEARQVMMNAEIATGFLKRMNGARDEAWLAAKAYVLAARRLGILLGELSSERHYDRSGGKRGSGPSERGKVLREIGLHLDSRATDLVRLGRVSDPDFQRYIQQKDRMPSLNGALCACGVRPVPARREQDAGWRSVRKRRAGVKNATNPSIDKAYIQILDAIGNLDPLAQIGSNSLSPAARGDLRKTIDALYLAEDLLKPYRAGYGE